MMMRPRSYGTLNRCVARAATHAINQTYGRKLRYDTIQKSYNSKEQETINCKTAQEHLFEAKCWFWTIIILFVIIVLASGGR